MAVLLSDTFDRANSATSLGSPDVGGPYAVQTGVWGIISNEAYLATVVAGGQVTFPAAINVDFSVKVPIAPATQVGTGLMIRWVDANNHWLLQTRPTNVFTLYHCAAGVYTILAPDVPVAVNDVIGLKAFGDQIAWYSNGQQRGQLTDHWFSTATATAGLRNGGTSTARWNDLLVQDQATLLNSWGAAPEASTVNLGLEAGATNTLATSLYKGRDTALQDESEIP